MSEEGTTRKDNKQKKALINNISQAINPIIKDLSSDDNCLQMPELALRCAQFFHSISQYCVSYYHNYVREEDNRKRKMIKKQEKDKGTKGIKRDRKRQDDNQANKQSNQKLELPKKPLTAYIIYFQDKKPQFVERYPTLGLSELTKLIAKQWKELTQAEKQVYLDKASQDRKRYEQQFNLFKAQYTNIYGKSNEDFEVKQNIPEEEEIEAIINAEKGLKVQQPIVAEAVAQEKQEENQSPKDGQMQGQNEEEEAEQEGQEANQAEQIDEEVDSEQAIQAKNDSQQQSEGEQQQQGSAEVAASGEHQQSEQ